MNQRVIQGYQRPTHCIVHQYACITHQLKPVHWSVMCIVSLTDLWYQSLICLNRWPIVVSSHWFPCIAIQIAVSFTSMPLSLTNTLLSLISVKTTLKNLACSRTINDQISNEDETWLCDCKPHGDALPERANSCDCQPKVKGKRKAQGIRRSKREAVCSRPPPSYQNGPPYVLWHYKSSVSSFSTFCHEWIVIPRREDVATGKQSFIILSPWLTELRKHKIRIPSEMAQNLMILHSYILVKVSPDRKIDAFV